MPKARGNRGVDAYAEMWTCVNKGQFLELWCGCEQPSKVSDFEEQLIIRLFCCDFGDWSSEGELQKSGKIANWDKIEGNSVQ